MFTLSDQLRTIPLPLTGTLHERLSLAESGSSHFSVLHTTWNTTYFDSIQFFNLESSFITTIFCPGHCKMRTSWVALSSIWLLASTAIASTPLQHCTVREEIKTDLCFAVSSWKNSTTGTNDLSLQISARFAVAATGWAAVGIGEKMNQALVFVMYPGGREGGMSSLFPSHL